MHSWSPTSWIQYRYDQAASYPDIYHLNHVVEQLSLLPPLVNPDEIQRLKQQVAQAGRGEAFILQGGDCAESFADCRPEVITNKLKILLQMSLVLAHDLHKPIIRIGRIAGQYAKPRSSDLETIDGVSHPCYRGDLINSPRFNAKARIPDPNRLLQGYHHSSMTLNFIRSVLNVGWTDLHHPKKWDLQFIPQMNQANEYQHILQTIANQVEGLKSTDSAFFTSHEALHLHYEQSLTRQVSNGQWYNLSTHLPWIGMRTASLDSAHLELLSGVNNPIGLKIGPEATEEWLCQILEKLNPQREEGRVLLISRMGLQYIDTKLPALIKAVQTTNIPVTWSCDPMHGNTEIAHNRLKTRHFDIILSEIQRAVAIHHEMNSHLGGVHFELTGDHVTECIGGARGLVVDDLKQAYHSLVDPRLNYEQSMEMAWWLSQSLRTCR